MLASMWSTKLFGYSWLLTAAGQYRPFSAVAESALRFTAQELGLTLSPDIALDLLDGYSRLDAWSDVTPALERLRAAGVRLAFLSNLGEAALRANMRRAGIEGYFAHVLSTDRVRRFKPAPEAYAMALDAFGLPKHKIGFASFGGWDAAGATWFGYKTAWINRAGAVAETLDPTPAFVSKGIEGGLSLAEID
jgi:2-haloacid dehalogenase